jgi:hypothetical protein
MVLWLSSGHTERFFWKQSRDTVYLYVPVGVGVRKGDVTLELPAKTTARLSIEGVEPLVLELAHPVMRDSTFWYLDRLDGTHQVSKVSVVRFDWLVFCRL